MTRLARLMVLIPDDMLSEIDLYRRYAPDLPPRTEAIRQLIRNGLTAASDAGRLGAPRGRHPKQAD